MLLPLIALLVSADINKLTWMSGCFVMENTARGVRIEEQWMQPAGGLMLGINRTLRGGRATAHEFLRIVADDKGAIVYTGLVGTKGATDFTLTKQTDDEVIFENPSHDFPQRIVYRRTADGLHARVDGMVNGKLRAQEFPMRAVACK